MIWRYLALRRAMYNWLGDMEPPVFFLHPAVWLSSPIWLTMFVLWLPEAFILGWVQLLKDNQPRSYFDEYQSQKEAFRPPVRADRNVGQLSVTNSEESGDLSLFE